MSARCQVHRPQASPPEDWGTQADFSQLDVQSVGKSRFGIFRTSLAVARSAVQSIRGRMLRMNSGCSSSSCCSSSASWKCKGNEAGDVLQSFTAHVTKLAVITFIVGGSGEFYVGLIDAENQGMIDRSVGARLDLECYLKSPKRGRWPLRGRRKNTGAPRLIMSGL